MVDAYLLAAEKGIPGEVYNICSGKGHKIQDVLDTLLKFSKIKIKVQQDPARMRPSDVMMLIGDNSKFVKQTGWKQTIEFEQTLKDLLEYWRERV